MVFKITHLVFKRKAEVDKRFLPLFKKFITNYNKFPRGKRRDDHVYLLDKATFKGKCILELKGTETVCIQ